MSTAKDKTTNIASFIGSLRKRLSDIFLLSSWDDLTIIDEKETISDIDELDHDWFVEEDYRPRSTTVITPKISERPEKVRRSMTVA